MTPHPRRETAAESSAQNIMGPQNVSLCNKSLGRAKPRTACYQGKSEHPNNYFNSSFICDFYFILFGEDNIKYGIEFAELSLFSVTFLALYSSVPSAPD